MWCKIYAKNTSKINVRNQPGKNILNENLSE